MNQFDETKLFGGKTVPICCDEGNQPEVFIVDFSGRCRTFLNGKGYIRLYTNNKEVNVHYAKEVDEDWDKNDFYEVKRIAEKSVKLKPNSPERLCALALINEIIRVRELAVEQYSAIINPRREGVDPYSPYRPLLTSSIKSED